MASSFSKDVGTAVDCFRPLLKKLRIREDLGLGDERAVYFMEVPELDFLNLDRWTIVLKREKLPDLCGRLITRYIETQDVFQHVVFLNDHLFYDTLPARMKRRMVIVHEFTHIAANIYAYSENPGLFFSAIKEKVFEVIDDLGNDDVSMMYKILRGKDSGGEDELRTLKINRHSHFYIGPEKIGLSYTDLYLNLLFSKGAFEEYFDSKKQKEFHSLIRAGNREDALDLYRKIVKEVAAAEWVPESFAMAQADGWLKKYIQTPIY